MNKLVDNNQLTNYPFFLAFLLALFFFLVTFLELFIFLSRLLGKRKDKRPTVNRKIVAMFFIPRLESETALVVRLVPSKIKAMINETSDIPPAILLNNANFWRFLSGASNSTNCSIISLLSFLKFSLS